MALIFGMIGQFGEEKEDWPQYVERLNHFFTVNDVMRVEKKRFVFLYVDVRTHARALQKLNGSFSLPRAISVAASSPDNVQTSADQQIVLLNPFMEAQ